MTIEERLISVVDDDESMRESLPDLLRMLGFDVQAFSSANEFLQSPWIKKTECLILDVAMPRVSGPELHRELNRRGEVIPVVFITAQRDERSRGPLINQGAVECLFKPFSGDELRDALRLVFK
ncbi:FixJ family two-component response regulator [Phyllobacterium sp. 1468]|uniref:response regulator n=1 Tax=Phyllobacterium sp. 1468 TaxID=2817759 RepID=UPI00285D553C|nr:response regulator [Phyllobacterium sp. 1468]MDR6635106.1 FixJ family two-component response regulator [Phyllobacterium sp. 1468]